MPEGAVTWIVGLPASGKTTLAHGIIRHLAAIERPHLLLDSDDLRPHLIGESQYGDGERERFSGAIAHLAVRAYEGGVHTVIAATAHRSAYRDRVRAEVSRYHEIWVRCSPETLRQRDPKGLYAQAAAGKIERLPGLQTPFEAPQDASLVLDSDQLTRRQMLNAALLALQLR
jgi:adenylylsulfate kinase